MSPFLQFVLNFTDNRQDSRRKAHTTAAVTAQIDNLEDRVLLTVGADGWTELAPSADSRVIYVSSSIGNDANDGLSEASPMKTIKTASGKLRNGFPDWLLLKSGDEFSEGTVSAGKGGRSVDEPLVISSYGTGPRPILSETKFFYYGPNYGAGYSWNYATITNLDFRGDYENNPSLSAQALLAMGNVTDITIEGNNISGYHVGLQFQKAGTELVSNSHITVRRNVVADNVKQGVLLGDIDGLLLEENVFDHNGYGGDGPSIFNHNVYLKDVQHAILQDNVFARGSNFGTKLSSDTPGGFTDFVVQNNLYFNNGISLDHSNGSSGDINTTFTHERVVIQDNVFTESGRTFSDGGKQDLAAWLLNSSDVEWSSNVFVHKPEFSGHPLLAWSEHHQDISIHDSVIYDWHLGSNVTSASAYLETNASVIDGFALADNEINLPAASYVDPSRTVGSYYASIGGTNNALAFLAAARNVSKVNWNAAFTADAVNDYIRAGFVRVLATPVFTTPNTTTTSDPLQTVSWNTVDGADAYDVWYSNLTTGQNPALTATTATASYTPATALPIGQYQIWVRAKQNGGPSSPWSVPITLRVNTPPTLTSLPTDGTNARPQLTWTSVQGAVRYEVWGDNLTTGATKEVNATNVTATTFTPVSDLGFSVYRFWVRGFDVKGVFTTWSVAQDYSRVAITTVVQPVIFDGLNSLPTITWNTIAGAARYELWVSNLTTGQNGIIRDTNVPDSSFVATQPLPFGTNRFWVRAFDSNGLATKWSLPLDAVNASALLSPVLPTFERRPTFTWTALPGVSSSELYIRVNGTVLVPTGLQGASWTPASDLPVGDLKWWVRLKAANGVFGPWSTSADTYIGGKSTVLAAGVPGNDASRIGVIAWKAVTGASRYILHVERIGVGVVILESNLTSTNYTTSAPLAAGAYRVWIKAIDGSDNVTGIWSNAFAFTVVGIQSEEPNSPAVPLFATRQLESVLSNEPLAAVSQLVASETAAASQQAAQRNEIPANREADRNSAIETESISDWVQPNMSGEALMSELDADLIDLLMSESHALASAL